MLLFSHIKGGVDFTNIKEITQKSHSYCPSHYCLPCILLGAYKKSPTKTMLKERKILVYLIQFELATYPKNKT